MDFIDFIPVAGVVHYVAAALFVLPLVSGTVLYGCARRQSVGRAWAMALGIFFAVLCVISNSVALSVVAF